MAKRKTPKIKFVNLHGHSCASVFDGLGYPQEHMDFAWENGVDALAITDHGNMNNLPYQVFHAQKMEKEDRPLKAVYGVEAYFIPSIKEWQEVYKKSKKKKNKKQSATVIEDEQSRKSIKDILNRRRHMVLLAKNEVGLRNIYKMISESYQKPNMYRFPRIDYDMLREHREGILATSACLGGVYAGDYWENREEGPEAVLGAMRETSKNMIDIFGEDWYGEVQWNFIEEQHELNHFVIQVCEEFGIELVSTADAHYPHPDLWQSREMYKALGWRSKDSEGLPQSIEEMDYVIYPKNGDEMWESYKESCERLEQDYDDKLIKESIERTHDIVFSKIERFYPDNTVRLPDFVVPDGKTADEFLKEKALKGLEEKTLDIWPEYYDRLEYELGVISSRGFSKYFLTMTAVSDEARRQMLAGTGRGSACGSLLAYVLDITEIDPIKWDTQFERFLRKDATDYPDIDYDVSENKVLKEYLIEKWGKYSVVPISNWNTLQLKSLIKDISKFYEIEFKEVNTVTQKMMKEAMGPAKTANGVTTGVYTPTYEEVKKYSQTLQKFLRKYPKIEKHIDALLGMPRSCSRHAGGVVIGDNLNKYMPLICSGGTIQTPWTEGQNVRHLEPMGFIKFDILGLGTLRIIEDAIVQVLKRHEGIDNPTFKDIKKFYDEKLHPDVVDFKDEKIYEVFSKGKWAGIFQFTEAGAQSFCQKVNPKNLLDLCAITSIYRPGPLGAGVDEDYIDARERPHKINYPNEIYREVTEETYGFLIYQEQIATLAHRLGKNITLDEGNMLRKVLTKKGTGKVAKVKRSLEDRFVEGCIEKGMTKTAANKMWQTFEYFSGYGFNKSHAVAYSAITFQCAWLLTYYPVEWASAFLNEESDSKLEKSIAIVKGMGYKIHAPNINISTDKWEISSNGSELYQPLTDIKGFGDKAYEQILAQRPFKNIEEFLFNDDIDNRSCNKGVIDKLVRSKALDPLMDDRFAGSKHFWNAVAVLRPANETELMDNIANEHLRQDKDFPTNEMVAHFAELTSVFPLDQVVPEELQKELHDCGVRPIGAFDEALQYVWAIPREKRVRKTKTGKKYWQLKMTDSTFKMTSIKIWNVSDKAEIHLNRPYIIKKVDYDPQWGFSTPWSIPFRSNFALVG